ncbi:hypothetical protein ACR9E3_04370 [Actinomycetospora sp. C-140]
MTTNGTVPRPSDVSGPILTEAARRMLPVLAGRVLAALVDRAVEKVDDLADRIGERSAEREPRQDEDQGRVGAAVGFLLEQARLFLAFVVRLAAQALDVLRRATERLRERRAPEGIDEAPDPEDVLDPDEFDDEYDDEFDDEDEEDRATVRA